MISKGTIIYTGLFNVLEMNAAGKRVLGNAKLLTDIGYKVYLFGVGPLVNNYSYEITHTTMENIDVFQYPNYLFYKKRYSYRDFFQSFKELVMKIGYPKIDFIITYGSPTLSRLNKCLLGYAKTHDIKYIADVVDWLIVKTRNPLFDLFKAIDDYYQKAYLNFKSDGLFVISNYLNNYYKRKKNQIIKIPPLSIKKNESSSFFANVPLKFIYAGFPFRKGSKNIRPSSMKDRIDIIIKIFASLKEKHEFVLQVVGIRREDILAAIPYISEELSTLADSIQFFGFLDSIATMELIKSSDFSVLYRDDNRSSRAGFPTKISESLSLGVPVIANNTGDILDYINESNGLIISSNHRQAVQDIQRIFEMTQDEIKLLKMNCINQNKFFYRNYVDIVSKFLSGLKEHRI